MTGPSTYFVGAAEMLLETLFHILQSDGDKAFGWDAASAQRRGEIASVDIFEAYREPQITDGLIYHVAVSRADFDCAAGLVQLVDERYLDARENLVARNAAQRTPWMRVNEGTVMSAALDFACSQ